ncbi:hypothetical protein [Methylobacterium sp. WL19]|uniref:hypothetical protein n=1 Tax=Methylobacterium sp. WL19 TaxID=2603896 RepID=UPI0011C801F0|nr:hypothetical protein [Methylobacterium sp. WL19]TXN33889.1 hypothetical protein FV220_00100 [Methylobacterium sp. WL19]
MDLFDARDVTDVEGIEPGWLVDEDGAYSAPEAPAPAEIIPDVSSAQAKIQLSRASFLVPVKAAVEALGGEAEIWFTDARTWQRNNPYVAELGGVVGLSPTEIDDLFREAAKIDA